MNRRDAIKTLVIGAAAAAAPAGVVDFDGPVRPTRDDVWIDVWLPPANPAIMNREDAMDYVIQKNEVLLERLRLIEKSYDQDKM